MDATLDKTNCQIHTPTALTLGKKKFPCRLSVRCWVGPRAALGIWEKKNISLDPTVKRYHSCYINCTGCQGSNREKNITYLKKQRLNSVRGILRFSLRSLRIDPLTHSGQYLNHMFNITKGCELFQQISSCMVQSSQNKQYLFRGTAFSIDVYNGDSLQCCIWSMKLELQGVNRYKQEINSYLQSRPFISDIFILNLFSTRRTRNEQRNRFKKKYF